MSNDTEAAHVLFPSDAPTTPPEWFKADQSAAEQRLMRRAEPPAQAQQQADTAPPAGPDADAAEKLFGSESGADFDKLVSGELDQYTLSAIQDGDTERADALKHATSALADDMRAAGTEASTLSEAFEIVRQSAGVTEMTHDQREASYNSGMTAVQEASISNADLSAARSFIRDLDRVSPGVIDSLRAHGAGNDIRLIKKAVAEARRRGY